MKGNFHVQFLGEGVAATSPPYPTPGWATTQVYPAVVQVTTLACALSADHRLGGLAACDCRSGVPPPARTPGVAARRFDEAG